MILGSLALAIISVTRRVYKPRLRFGINHSFEESQVRKKDEPLQHGECNDWDCHFVPCQFGVR